MKKLYLPLLALSSLLALGFAHVTHKQAQKAEAAEELAISNGGDAFALLDKQYDASTSFVYTADLHFKNGQAGGLAFGCEENAHYFVINMDRYENHIKLMYFAQKPEGGYQVDELRVADFIGNDKMTDSERAMVNPKVREIENVNLKLIITIEEEHAYAEFFVEGIKRFGIDSVIDLNDLGKSYHYEGGYLGMNCFNSDVYLSKIESGLSDYSYFSEPYRNQYHLQPFAKWTNDPNALCYYNGYYHVFYQTNPFGLLWGDMYWGHARSRDLIHFEFLPLCLFPETDAMGFGPGNAFMWSGCAITYTKGMSAAIDEQNWFPNGNGNGMLAIYTRDGGLQDQVVISSDDEGLTWTKRHRIPQTICGYDYKVDFRDPKVFPLVQDAMGNVSVWGMTLSSYNLNKGWFLKSTNLLDWSIAGSFPLPTPECIGIGTIKDEHGETKTYLTNKSRTYILGTLSYNPYDEGGKVTFIDESGRDISTYTVDNIPLKPLDFGPDSYASQSFYITDPASEYYGKDLVINWFSGDLNASFCTGPGEYAGLRERWNGGFTTPVMYGLKNTTDGYRLTQTPITVENVNLEKENVVTLTNEELNAESDNPLSDVHTHIFEMEASITTKDNGSITFKVDVGDDEYMQLGWNKTDGYYVDRTYLNDKGIATNIDWHTKYASHILGDSDTKTFYVLSDNGGLEVFCEDYSISFYFVTTASIYSTGASLKVDGAVVNSLKLNQIKSAYQKEAAPGEGVLYVSTNEVDLDTNLYSSKFITCWFSGVGDLEWEQLTGEDVVESVTSNQGINITALRPGDASFKVKAGDHEEIINVLVHESYFDSEFTFKKENVVSGQWVMGEGVIIGETKSGNGFLLADQGGSDFTYTGEFDIVSGTAASLVFRAKADMSAYLVANYDSNEKIVKLWSTHGELARSGKIELDTHNIVLTVNASYKDINVFVNGNSALHHHLGDDEPLTGLFGLNVFSAKAEFKSLALTRENYEYNGVGALVIPFDNAQFVTAIYNVTLGNIKLEPGFYYQDQTNLYIKEDYFRLLNEDGIYQFKVVSNSSIFTINVDVTIPTSEVYFEDLNVEKGLDVIVYVGILEVTSVSVNNVELEQDKYYVKDYTLHISGDCFEVGDNEVSINLTHDFMVYVTDLDETETHTKTITTGCGGSVIAPSVTIFVTALLGCVLLGVKKFRKE